MLYLHFSKTKVSKNLKFTWVIPSKNVFFDIYKELDLQVNKSRDYSCLEQLFRTVCKISRALYINK